MMDIIWPALRPFLVMLVMLATMWEPKNRERGNEKRKKEDWIDAEYETLD